MMTNTPSTDLVETITACPSCDSTRLTQQDAPGQWIGVDHFAPVKERLGLSTCEVCGLVITNPRPGIDLLTSFYNQPGYECHELHYDASQSSYANARFSILEQYTSKGVVLDYGCGSGNMLNGALARGWSRVCGIEIGKGARDALLKQGFEVYPDLESAQSLKGQIDVVTMIQVLEHLVDPGQILKGVSELLRPGGIFVVEVPNAGSLRARIAGSAISPAFSRPIQRYQAFPIHLYHFESRQLKTFLGKHGFRIIDLQTLGMGVEELWDQPAGKANGEANDDALQRSEAASTAALPSLAVSTVKKAIKGSMSRLRLGEQLFAVCRKA